MSTSRFCWPFSNVASESEEDEDDEEEDGADPELLKAIEAEVESRRALEQSGRAKSSEFVKRSDKGDVWTEVPMKHKGAECGSIIDLRPSAHRGVPQPFCDLGSSDAGEADHPGRASTSGGPVENLLEIMQRQLDAASSFSASPSPSLSGISPIHATNAHTQKQVEHFRLDRTADSPPGLEREVASVTVRIPGSENVTIVGQVMDLFLLAPIIPVSIDSVANIVVEPPMKSEDADVEVLVDNLKDFIKKFKPTEVFDTIDTLEIADSSCDMLCDLSKLASDRKRCPVPAVGAARSNSEEQSLDEGVEEEV